MKLKSILPIAAAFAATTSLVQADHHMSKATKTIVEIAAGNDDFSTLVAAVKAAGLAETLSGEGPFTVFAPTNEAFEKLPEGTVEMLLKPENKEKLTEILTYHVVPAKVMAKDVKAGYVETVNGESLMVSTEGGVMVDKAKGRENGHRWHQWHHPRDRHCYHAGNEQEHRRYRSR